MSVPLSPPQALRVAALLWAVSALPGAAAAALSSIASEDFPSDDPIAVPALIVVFVLVWGARVVLAFLLLRRGAAGARTAGVIRVVLLALGVLTALPNDVGALVRAGGGPLVVVLAVLDLVLIVAATVATFRPVVNDHVRAGVAERAQRFAPWPGAPATAPQWRPTNTMALLALVFAFVFSPLGVVFGIVGRSQIRYSGEAGSGFATAGIVLGVVFTVLPVVIVGSVLLLHGAG